MGVYKGTKSAALKREFDRLGDIPLERYTPPSFLASEEAHHSNIDRKLPADADGAMTNESILSSNVDFASCETAEKTRDTYASAEARLWFLMQRFLYDERACLKLKGLDAGLAPSMQLNRQNAQNPSWSGQDGMLDGDEDQKDTYIHSIINRGHHDELEESDIDGLLDDYAYANGEEPQEPQLEAQRTSESGWDRDSAAPHMDMDKEEVLLDSLEEEDANDNDNDTGRELDEVCMHGPYRTLPPSPRFASIQNTARSSLLESSPGLPHPLIPSSSHESHVLLLT